MKIDKGMSVGWIGYDGHSLYCQTTQTSLVMKLLAKKSLEFVKPIKCEYE